MRRSFVVLLSLCIAVLISQPAQAAPTASKRADAAQQTLTVATQSTRESKFGLCAFLENNINYGTDGGLYAELIRNRAFQEGGNSDSVGSGTLSSWSAAGGANLTLTDASPLSSALPKSVIVSGGGGLRNTGFFGVPVKKQSYDVSFYARTETPAAVDFTAGLYSADGAQTFATVTRKAVALTTEWQQINVTLDSSVDSDAQDNTFGLDIGGQAPVQLNLISVFPPTWKDTVARADLAEAVADLKPVYFRLPGGNTLEGNTLAQRFVWNNSVGSLTQRPGRRGTWAGWDTDGYGLHEAYDLFTKMGAEPILGVFAGFTLNGEAVAEADLAPYVQSAKDEVAYLTSAAQNEQRVADGGSNTPWTLPWIEIGNEDYLNGPDGNATYNAYRYDAFSEAVHDTYPSAGLISSSPYYTPKSKLQAIDQHDYDVPNSLIRRWSERDEWPRNGTQVPELEFSTLNSGLCTDDPDTYNNDCRLRDPTLIGAVAEATYMMGLERNGDITFSAAYAPLFNRAGHSQWTPDLITFDALNVVKTTSYFTQYAFGQNRIANVHNVTAAVAPGPVYWSVGTQADDQSAYTVKLSNVDDAAQTVVVQLDNQSTFSLTDDATLWIMSGSDKQAANTISKPDAIVPVQRALTASDIVNGKLQLELPPNAFAVVHVHAAAS